MLTIELLGEEYWDDEKEEFVYPKAMTLQFEHSLVSLSKWESRFHKPFLTQAQKSEEEMRGYVYAMLLTPGVTEDQLNWLSDKHLAEIDAYINDPMTGTTFKEVSGGRRGGETFSSELIYYWMNQYQIPYEAREWHLNQLFTLIRVHHHKNQKPKQMSKAARAEEMRRLNAERRAQMGTKG